VLQAVHRRAAARRLPAIETAIETVKRDVFTSMFVERMKVLEYRQKIEVGLSTFPDFTNTETPRKLVFILTCVCVCVPVCLSVCLCAKNCQWISFERIDRFG